MTLWSVVAIVSLLLFVSTSGHILPVEDDCCECYKTLRNIECRYYPCRSGYQCELTEDEEPVCVLTVDVDIHRYRILDHCPDTVKEYLDMCTAVCNSKRTSCKLKGKEVCGHDGLIYPSRCQLRKRECLLNYSIGIAEMELCESSNLPNSMYPKEVVVSFDQQCIEETALNITVATINRLARQKKLHHALRESMKQYEKWLAGSKGSVSIESIPYNNLILLHAAKILVEEGRLTIPSSVFGPGALEKVSEHGIAGLPQFHPEVDSCNTAFIRSAALVDALYILNKTLGQLFEYSPLMEKDCFHASTVRLPCEAANIPGFSGVQWFFNGMKIPVRLSGRYYVDSKGALYIQRVQLRDLGEYTCKVRERTSTVLLVYDRCPCSFEYLEVLHKPIIKDQTVGCLHVERIHATDAKIINVRVDEVSLKSGVATKIDVENAMINKLVISNFELARDITITNSEIGNLLVTNLTGVRVSFHNVLIHSLTMIRTELYDCGIQNANISNANFHFSRLLNCFIQNTSIQGLNMNYSMIHSSKLTNTAVTGLNLYRSTVSGLMSDQVSYVDNYLYGLTVNQSVFTNTEVRNYTTIGSNRFGLTTINMTASDFHSVDATVIDDVTTNVRYWNLEVSNLTVNNASSSNVKYVKTGFKNSTFDSVTWYGALFTKTSFHYSTFNRTSFDHVVLKDSSIKNALFMSTNSTNTLLSGVDTEDTLLQDTVLNNYTTISLTERNVVVHNMVATEVTSYNTLIVNKTTMEASYVDVLAVNTTATMTSTRDVLFINYTCSGSAYEDVATNNVTYYDSYLLNSSVTKWNSANDIWVGYHEDSVLYSQGYVEDGEVSSASFYNVSASLCQLVNVLHTNVEYVNADFNYHTWHGSPFYDSTFNKTSFDHIVMEDFSIKSVLFMSTNFTNTLLSNVDSEDTLVQDCVVDNYTIINNTRRNVVIQNMMATDFTAYNTLIFNKTTTESSYVRVLAFNTTAMNTTTKDVLFVNYTNSDSAYEDATTNNVAYYNSRLLNSSITNWISSNDAWVGYHEDNVSYSHASFENGDISNASLSNISASDYYVVNVAHENVHYEDMSTYNHSTVNSTFKDCTFLNLNLTDYVDTNGLYVNIYTADVLYQESKQTGTTIKHWFGLRENWSQNTGEDLNFNNVTLTDSYFNDINWNNVTISQWQLENGTFIRGNYSWFSVDELDSLDTTWENNTGFNVNLTNVRSFGTQITNNRICEGNFVNYTGRNQLIQYYEASGLVTENAIYENLTKTNYLYADSAFLNSTYNTLTIAKGMYRNVFINKQYINHSYQSDIGSIHMTAIDMHLFDAEVENNLFQHVLLINSTQTEVVVQNDTWIHTELENTTHSNMHYGNLTYASDVLFQSHKFVNSEFENVAAHGMTTKQSLFHNVSIKNGAFYNLTTIETVFQHFNISDTMYYLLHSSDSQMLNMSASNTTYTNINSQNDAWVGVKFENSRVACPVFDGGVSVDITIVASIISHAEFKNRQHINIHIYQSIFDELGWNTVTVSNIVLQDVNATRIQTHNSTMSGMKSINVFVHQLMVQLSDIEVVHTDNFVVELLWMWNSTLRAPEMAAWTNVIRSPFTFGVSKPCNVMINPGDNHTSRFRMCDVDDNTTYISCDSNQLIVNVTAVSTMQEIHGCNASTDDVRERIHNLCVLTPSCTVSSAALGLNCSVPEICFNINYTCKQLGVLKGVLSDHVSIGGDDSHQEHITGNYPVQLEQCNFYDNATYISCDDNELIMETTIVSTIREMTEFGDCNREDFLRGVTDLCFLKPSCYVSMSTIGLDYCPMRDVCFKISYICKPIEAIKGHIKDISVYSSNHDLLSGDEDYPVSMSMGLCDSNRRTMSLECDGVDEVIVEISTEPEAYVCYKTLTDDIAQRVVNLCLLKPDCEVSASALGLDHNCPIENVCSVGMNYSCKPIEDVKKAFERVKYVMKNMASKPFVIASGIVEAIIGDMKDTFFNGSSPFLEEHAVSLDASTLTSAISSGMCPSSDMVWTMDTSGNSSGLLADEDDFSGPEEHDGDSGHSHDNDGLDHDHEDHEDHDNDD